MPYVRTCLHKKYVRIFKHILVDVKAKICSWAVTLQEFLTQTAAEIAEKTCLDYCEDKFSKLLGQYDGKYASKVYAESQDLTYAVSTSIVRL